MKAEEIAPFVGQHVFLFVSDDRSMPCWVRGVSGGRVWVSETDADGYDEPERAEAFELADVDAVAVGGEGASAAFAWMREALAS